jgi:hypothetical protein
MMLCLFVLEVNAFNFSGSSTPDSSSIEASPANILWEKTYGGKGNDRAYYAMAVENGYLIVGSSESFEAGKTVAWVLQMIMMVTFFGIELTRRISVASFDMLSICAFPAILLLVGRERKKEKRQNRTESS